MFPQLQKRSPSGTQKSHNSAGELIPMNTSSLKVRGSRKAVMSISVAMLVSGDFEPCSSVSLESNSYEDTKGVHGVFQVFVILGPTLHELGNNLRGAIGKREKIHMNVLSYC